MVSFEVLIMFKYNTHCPTNIYRLEMTDVPLMLNMVFVVGVGVNSARECNVNKGRRIIHRLIYIYKLKSSIIS